MNLALRLVALVLGVAAAPSILAVPIAGRGTWETTLQARDLTGDGRPDAYYDTAQNITWLADAVISRTLGLPNRGRMDWNASEAFVDSLNIGGVTGWRQFKAFPIGGGGCTKFDRGSGIDCGYSPNPISSEMAHLYYVTLGNVGAYDKGFESYTNTGPFTNVRTVHYWSETVWIGRTTPGVNDRAWNFGGDDRGVYQDIGIKYAPKGMHHVWPVIDGDVGVATQPSAAAVPEMSTLLLMAVGLLSVGWALRRRRA